MNTPSSPRRGTIVPRIVAGAREIPGMPKAGPYTPPPVAARANVEYDFYRCAGPNGCGRLITRPEMVKFLIEGKSCPNCGGLSFSPRNIGLHHWFLPRVWSFAVARIRGRI